MVLDHVTMPSGYIDKVILFDVPRIAALHRAFQNTTVLDFVFSGAMNVTNGPHFTYNRYHRPASPPPSHASVVSVSDDDNDYDDDDNINYPRITSV